MTRPFSFALTLLALFALTVPAVAQRDAGAKARGDYFFYGHSSHSHLHGASQHTGHYGRYLESTQTVSPHVSSMTHTAIDHHINQTQAHLDALQQGLEADNNQAALKGVATVNKHLGDAREHHDTLQKLSETKPVDAAASKKVVAKLQASLDTALGELEKLLESLHLGKPPARTATSAK
jgi:hypothetical protein